MVITIGASHQVTYTGGGDINFLCKMVFVQSNTNMTLDGNYSYTSSPNGYFKYTVNNKTSNTLYNDIKYFNEIRKAFNKWIQ